MRATTLIEAEEEIPNNPEETKELSRSRSRAIALAFILCLLALWETGSRTGILHQLIVPSPTMIIATFPEVVLADFFISNVATTLWEIVVGFSIALVLGFSFGVLLASSKTAHAAVYPVIIALQAMPKITWVPIFVTWFGFGLMSKIVMAAAIAFFPMFLNTYTGLSVSGRDETKMLKSLTANPRQIFWKLRLPGSMPFVFTGIKLAWAYSLIGVIVAEFLGARAGVGFLIQTFNFQLRIPEVFVLIICLSAFSVSVYKLIEATESRVLFWNRAQ